MSRIIIILFYFLTCLTVLAEETSKEAKNVEDIANIEDFTEIIKSFQLTDGTAVAIIPKGNQVGLIPAGTTFTSIPSNSYTLRKMGPMYATGQMETLKSRIEKLEDIVQKQAKVIKILAEKIKEQ